MPPVYNFIGPEHRDAIVDHLLGLDRDDRVLRFSIPAPDPIIRGYCERWHFDRDIVAAAWDGERLVGMIHLPVYDERVGTVGELGVSVATDCRKRGIATQLAARTLLEGHRRGLARIYIHFLTRNRPMGLLARRFTDDIVLDGDESHATIDLTDDAVRRATGVLRAADTGAPLEFRRPAEQRPVELPGASPTDRDARRRIAPVGSGVVRPKAA
jgi:GNAT superfamily N-acetyltransferase